MRKSFIHGSFLNDLENKKLFLIARLSCRNRAGEIPMSTFPYEADPGKKDRITIRHSAQRSGSGCTYGEGEGRTKKASEQQAAYQAILRLQEKQ